MATGLGRRLVLGGRLVAAGLGVLAQSGQGEMASATGQLTLAQAKLPAGVYEVSFQLQVDRRVETVTPLATLTVGAPGYPDLLWRKVTPIHFSVTNAPVTFVFRYDNWKAQDAEVRLHKHKGAGPQLSVHKIAIVPRREVCIGTVWPGKIIYDPGETAKGFVAVFNGSAEPRTVTLRCALESGLDRVRPLKEDVLTLAAGERREAPVEWNTGQEEYGFALAATLLDAQGKRIDESREYFSVADNLWKVALTQRGGGDTQSAYREHDYRGVGPNEGVPVREIKQAEKQLEAELAKPFAPAYWNYCNWNEYYAWAPEDFFHMAPEADYWYTGTGNYTYGKRALRMSIELVHRRGRRAIMYTNPFVCGYGAEKVYQRHPDWFTYRSNGMLVIGPYYQKKLEAGQIMDGPDNPWKLQQSPYAMQMPVNIAMLDPLDAHIEQFVKARQMFGWDGVRYDNFVFSAGDHDFHGRKIVPAGGLKERDELEVRAWAYMRKQLAKKLGRRFVMGTNMDYALRGNRAAAWEEVCRQGGLLMEEAVRDSYEPGAARNRWRDYLTYYHGVGNRVRALGGHHLIIGLDRQHAVDQLYLNIFTYAMRAHPYSYQYNADSLPMGDYSRFMTRYSALIWDNECVKPLAEAEKRIEIASDAPLWGKELACVRQAPKGKRQYVLHLINPPVQERIMTDPANTVPPPRDNVRVTLKTVKGDTLSRALLLTAEPTLRAEPLPLTVGEGQVSVTAPRLYFWSVVVFE